MPVEHHGIATQRVAEAAHGQSVHTVAVDDAQRSLQDHRPVELTVVTAGGCDGPVTVGRARAGPGRLSRHCTQALPFCLVIEALSTHRSTPKSTMLVNSV